MAITETILSDLREAKSEAKEKWEDFQAFRTQVEKDFVGSGKDVLTYMAEDDRQTTFDAKHAAYQEAASKVTQLQASFESFGADAKGPTEPPAEKVTLLQMERPKSLGQQFIESDGYTVLRDRGLTGNWSSGPVELNATTLTEDSGSGGPLIQPQVVPGITPILFRRLVVADLMLSGTTDSNTIRYLKETTATNAAAAVLEGGQKPESTLVFAAVDEPVRKIATFLPVSDEMLEDYSQIRSYLDNRLRLFIQLAEETALLTGNGSPTLTGLLNRTGKQTAVPLGSDSVAVATYKQITAIRANAFVEPTGIIFHPTDWQSASLEQDDNSQFYGGGPFYGPYGNGTVQNSVRPYWGLQVVVTPAISQGTALVGDFTQAQVFRKGGITVEASNSHADFFQYDKTAFRAEERLALAVYRPGAFGTITGL